MAKKPDGVGASDEGTMLVRIKPIDRKAGHTTSRYMIRKQRFFENQGWYRVPIAFAEVLKKKHVNGDVRLPKIFDVCTRDEALELERREKAAKEKQERASASKPHGTRRVEDLDAKRGGSEGSIVVDDVNPVAKSRRAIVADGADDEEPEDETPTDPDAGLVQSIGKIEDDPVRERVGALLDEKAAQTPVSRPAAPAPRAPAQSPASRHAPASRGGGGSKK
jgi:hypothetical protein